MLHLLLATVLVFAPGSSTSASYEEDGRDKVTLKNGKVVPCRVIQNHDEEYLYYREPGKVAPTRQKRTDIASVGLLVRNRIDSWLNLRKPGQTSEQRWKVLEAALAADMPALARLQAYDILCDDPGFVPAHLLLGHEEKRSGWMWSLDTTGEKDGTSKKVKHVSAEDFHARILERPNGLVLVSENYRFETNTSLRLAVDLLFDLERTYCTWLEVFGEDLVAAESVWNLGHQMVVRVYSSATEGFTENRTSERFPYYSASVFNSIASSPNVVFTYLENPTDARPLQFFDLAIQQLMYTTLGLGHKRAAPPAIEPDHWAHWVELGFGWYMEQGFSGLPGYAKYNKPVGGAGFVLPKELANYATLRAGDRTLHRSNKEVTHIASMEWRRFYILGLDGEIHRAKARTLVAYLITQNPPALTRGNKDSGVEALPALLCYLRGAFLDPKSHSTSEFDKCLNGKIEGFAPGWREWVRKFAI